MTPCVYSILNNQTGHCYIGSSTKPDHRRRMHFYLLRKNKHWSKKMQDEFNTFGECNFSVEVIEQVPTAKIKNDLYTVEQKWLDFFQPYFNSVKRSDSVKGYKHTQETREKLRISSTGNKNCLGLKLSEERRIKCGLANKGRKYSDEVNKKKGRFGVLNHNYMTKHSDEMRAKLSAGQRAWYLRREKKRVYQFDKDTKELIRSFKDYDELEDVTGLSRKAIVKGINANKNCKGFRWSYKEVVE